MLSTPYWVRVLATIEEARFILQQMCENHLGHYQQAAVEPMDLASLEIACMGDPETATVKVIKRVLNGWAT